jgi:hypothetical protein
MDKQRKIIIEMLLHSKNLFIVKLLFKFPFDNNDNKLN